MLRRRRFFQGRRIRGSSVKDLTWLAPGGAEMSDAEWQADGIRALGLRLAGDAIDDRGPRGERIVDDTLLLLLNAGEEDVEFTLPDHAPIGWRLMFDTRAAEPPTPGAGTVRHGGSTYRLVGRSVALFRLPRSE